MTEININTIDEAEIFYRNMIGLKIPTKTKKNKGEFGQLVESAIGHAPSSAHLDLDDGEIKTVCLKPSKRRFKDS